MTRFFIRPDQISGKRVGLDAGDAHHLRAVLKAKAGDTIAVLDGSCREFTVVLTEVGKNHAEGKIVSEVELATEARPRITVAQALPKMAEKMEQVLQRGTEVGAASFWAFSSERSLTHLTGERHDKRLSRWREIVKTAAEQSHRGVVPEVRADHSFRQVVQAAAGFDLALFAYELETKATLRSALSDRDSPASILLAIGPEGGYTDDEAKDASRHGFVSVSLGPRILRTETAALVMLSQLIYALDQ